MTKQTVSMFS